MNTKEFEVQVQGIIDLRRSTEEKLEKFRREYFEAKAEHAKQKRVMEQLHRDKILFYSADPTVQGVRDPMTGKVNKDYSSFLLDRKLEQDPEYLEQFGLVWEIQERMEAASLEILVLGERLGDLMSDSTLLAALMNLMAGTYK